MVSWLECLMGEKIFRQVVGQSLELSKVGRTPRRPQQSIILPNANSASL